MLLRLSNLVVNLNWSMGTSWHGRFERLRRLYSVADELFNRDPPILGEVV